MQKIFRIQSSIVEFGIIYYYHGIVKHLWMCIIFLKEILEKDSDLNNISENLEHKIPVVDIATRTKTFSPY